MDKRGRKHINGKWGEKMTRGEKKRVGMDVWTKGRVVEEHIGGYGVVDSKHTAIVIRVLQYWMKSCAIQCGM